MRGEITACTPMKSTPGKKRALLSITSAISCANCELENRGMKGQNREVDFDERLFRYVVDGFGVYSSDISQSATNDPPGNANSSIQGAGSELRKSSIMARECSGYASSGGLTDAPSSLTEKYPVDPVTRRAGPLSSVTLPFNRNATTSFLVEMYVTRILRDSAFRELSVSLYDGARP